MTGVSRGEIWGAAAGCVGVIALAIAPHVVLGEASFVTIHDSLDSELVWRHMLVEAAAGLDPTARIDQVMGGLSRGSLPTGLSLLYGLFAMLDPFWAYAVHKAIVHAVAFLGMWGLVRRHLLPQPELAGVALGAALCFGITPHYAVFSLSIAGQPLLLMALLDLAKARGRAFDWAIVAAFPFASSFAHVGTFILGLLGAGSVAERVRSGVWPWRLLGAAALLLALYLVVEHALIATMWLSDVTSHRELRGIPQLDLGTSLGRAWQNFLHGQYHAPSRHEFVLVLALASLGIPSRNGPARRGLVLGIAACLAISLFYGVYGSWSGFAPLKESVSLLRQYQLTRIHWLHPLLWSLVFAWALARIASWRVAGRAIGVGVAGLAIAIQAGQLLRHSPELQANLAILRGEPEPSHVSYEAYRSRELFDEVSRFIDRPKSDYRVASVGLPPAVAQWNGFHTIDAYLFSYPLDYHRRLRAVFAGELAKDEDLRTYYDAWGCRAKIFSAELAGRGQRGHEGQTRIDDLALNLPALRDLGAEYLLSRYVIGNAASLGLGELARFEAPDSPWRVVLYRVPDAP